MISEHDKEYECYNHTFERGDYFNTFGGEAWLDDDYYIDEYGIQCDDMSIFKIPAANFKKLAIEMINHLIANGHDFQMVENDGSPYLTTK